MTDTIPQTEDERQARADEEARRGRGVEPMDLTAPDLDLMRQWFDAVHDVSPEYLDTEDFALARRLYERLGMRVPNSIKVE